MKKILSTGLLSLLLSGVILLMGHRALASHIFAMDLRYTWVSGNTYNVQVIVYGNCGGDAFPTLGHSRPVICTYDGATFVRTDTCVLRTSDSGTNVTQVCPAYVDSTTCSGHPAAVCGGGTLEGTKRFFYSVNVTVPGTSAVYRFTCGHFWDGGPGGGGADPGRSASITNITAAGTSVVYLEDTLNNSPTSGSGHNSSPTFAVLPTPYYNINAANSYSPVPSDPDGDALNFKLVTARQGPPFGVGLCVATPSNCTYAGGFSGTAPIGVTTPITVSATTGQINFTTNSVAQQDDIVYNVRETRGGVLVGTSQREMTFNIKACSITPPSDAFKTPTAGVLTDSFTLDVCNNVGAFSVNIKPVSTTGSLIYVDTLHPSGLPAGMTYTVTSDSTSAPVVTLSWTTTGIPVGSYDFYLTFFVNSCPVGGTTTQGYTINIDSAAGPIAGTLSVCPLATTTLSDHPTGGTWTSGSTAIATVGTSSGIVTGVAGGTSIITYTESPAKCTAFATVTVNAGPSPITGRAGVCVGLLDTLSDASTSGTWSTTSAAATVEASTGVVHGVSAGTAIITYSIPPNGCFDTMLVTVYAMPSAITGSAVLCSGLTTTLNSTPAGGTWTSGSTPVATIGSSSGVVFGVTGGTSIITYAYSTGNCSVTRTVTVNPGPAAITGTTGVCVGGTTVLSSTTTGGTWSTTGSVATVSGGTVTGLSVGTQIITYSAPPSGCYDTIVVTVTSGVAAITGTLTVCTGQTTALHDATTGGVWSSTNNSIATVGSTGIVTGVAPGVDTIKYSLGGGCAASVVVTVSNGPAAIAPSTPVTLCTSNTAPFTDPTPGGTWSSSNTAIASVSSGGLVTAGTTTGTVNISYTIGTCYVIKTVTVTAGGSPNVPASATLCIGTNLTFTNSSPGGTWSSSLSTIATISSGGVAGGVAVGTANIIYTVGTCVSTSPVTVNTSPAAIAPSTPVSLCAGGSTPFADPTTGGVWSSTNTTIATVSTTGTVFGASPGIDTIKYTIGGCSVSKVVTVTSGGSPITPGSATICTGTTVLMSNATPGGTWSSVSTAIATVNSTGTVFGAAAGTTTIDYTVGTCVATATVTVTPGAAALTPAGGATLCVGSTATFVETVGGGTWSSMNTAVATVTSGGVVTGAGVGVAVISYTLGTCGVSTTVTVTAGGAPIVPGSATVCIGTPTTFTNAGVGGTWSISPTTIATVTGGTVTGITAGTATLSYSIGTCIATAPITVSTGPAAISPSGPISICTANTTTYADATPGGVWSSGTTSVATVGSTGIVTGVSAGVANITYSIGGCYAVKPVTVTAGAAPISPSAPNLCTGNTLALTESVGGGTWSSSNLSVASVSSTGFLTAGTIAGTSVITYSLGTCTTSITVTVSLAATSGTITGPSVTCVGTDITLVDAAPGGVWTSGSAGIASVSTGGVVHGVSAGVVTISYSVTNGCGTSSATHVVTVDATGATAPILGLSTVCAGTTIVLTDATPSGVWSASNGNASVTSTGLVTGITPGTDTIRYTVSSSCGSGVVTKVITIGPFLTAGTIFGPTSICGAGPITLTDATTGGVWSSSNTGIATVDATGHVTGTGSGVDTIFYTTTASCGTAVASHVVTVSAGPDAGTIVGTPTICVGDFTLFTDAAPGGVWSSYNTNASVTTGGLVTGVTAGTDTIYYTVTSSCGTLSAKYPINIVPGVTVLPISGSATTLCLGSSMTLTDATPGGAWSATNGSVIVSSIGLVTAMSPGVDTILYTVSSTCGSVSAIYVVTVSPLTLSAGTITGPSSVCVSSVITLTDTAAGGVWSSINANATITTGGLVTGILPGLDTIAYTVTGACGVVQATKVITIIGLPAPGSISGPAVVCIGASVTYSVTGTTGGGWTISNTNATIGSTSGVVTGVSGGSSVITYSLTNICGTVIATMNIAINPAPTVDSITGVSKECIGGSTTLFDATPGGVWSSSNPAVSTVDAGAGIVTGVSAGVDTIYYTITDGAGCTAAARINNTVNTVPVPTPITGPTVFCAGTSHLFTNAMPGGTWSTSNVVVATIDGTTGMGVGVSGGTANIYYIVSNGCGTATNTLAVTVNPIPYAGIISGPDSLCGNTTITLTDSLVSGGVWSSSNRTVATIGSSTGIVYGLAIGEDTMYYTVVNGFGCAGSASKIIHVNDIMPNVVFAPAGTATLCRGHFVNMHVTASAGSGGLTYQWEQDGSIIPGATNSSYSTYTSGVFAVVVSSGLCSVTLTGTSVIMAPPNPVISFTPPDILYTSSFVSYQWFLDWVPIAGATSNLIHEIGNGVYHVVVTDVNGCTDTSGQYSAILVNEVNSIVSPDDIRIFPNPSNSIVNIESPVKVNVSVLSVDGKVLIDKKKATSVDVTPLADGMYMIMVYDENSKLLIKKAKFAKIK